MANAIPIITPEFDKMEYLIVLCETWRVWNNGFAECYTGGKWRCANSKMSIHDRNIFLKAWEHAEVDHYYNFSWSFGAGIFPSKSTLAPKFLGFKPLIPPTHHDYDNTSNCKGEITFNQNLIKCSKCSVIGINYEHKGR